MQMSGAHLWYAGNKHVQILLHVYHKSSNGPNMELDGEEEGVMTGFQSSAHSPTSAHVELGHSHASGRDAEGLCGLLRAGLRQILV